VLLSTSRELVVAPLRRSLAIAGRCRVPSSTSSARCTPPPPLRFVLAKGGITSSDVATEGLRIRRARSSVSCSPGWSRVAGADGEADAGLPLVVFAGNVGETTALAEAVSRLRQL